MRTKPWQTPPMSKKSKYEEPGRGAEHMGAHEFPPPGEESPPEVATQPETEVLPPEPQPSADAVAPPPPADYAPLTVLGIDWGAEGPPDAAAFVPTHELVREGGGVDLVRIEGEVVSILPGVVVSRADLERAGSLRRILPR